MGLAQADSFRCNCVSNASGRSSSKVGKNFDGSISPSPPPHFHLLTTCVCRLISSESFSFAHDLRLQFVWKPTSRETRQKASEHFLRFLPLGVMFRPAP